ncbi:helix-turn-helix domain-containing protein [Microbacterium sp. MYb62]|uniref:helix-turn-helix domain-containing protein n=1 Tax=Microbacterium sp. MYb62 TaxID=1848690 RepID=UPI000CFE1974|nr:helix-turn-helix domain-containing protein [Microbacterium sp. MYb62]PRB19196.1 hypothetical protein CQ042_01990 [Microbacterium sp. MYb62]
MRYTRHAPATRLSGFVEHYWSVTAPAPPGALRAVLVPNGRATVQFCLGTPGRRFAAGGPSTRNANVYLPVGVEPFVIEQEGDSHYVGIQFTPWGARSLFPEAPTQPAQVVDAIGPLPDKSRLRGDPADELDRWLGEFARKDPSFAEVLPEAVRQIDADPSVAVVKELRVALAVSSSTLYRAFRDLVGLSPKQYIQVMRHRAFTDRLLERADREPAALLAAIAGYADQPHASREFTRFTGMTVTAFRHRYDGIARLMAQD